MKDRAGSSRIGSRIDALERRSTEEVIDDHLRLAQEGELEEDLDRNYHDDVAFLTSFGVHHGRKGARFLYERLRRLVPGADFEYAVVESHGDLGFLHWTARSPKVQIRDGADSYLVRDGRIRAQTIHYAPERGD